MEPLFKFASGYIKSPEATEKCAYCTYRVGDRHLKRIGSSYSYLWRNFGFYWVYILFNIGAMILLYYFIHVRRASFKKSRLVKSILGRIKKE